jgi:hypothetical protein
MQKKLIQGAFETANKVARAEVMGDPQVAQKLTDVLQRSAAR